MSDPIPSTVASRRLPTALAVACLVIISTIVLFPSLGRPAMEPDESLYALATDQIRATGDWWTLSPQPPSPYFNKPPLYMWLSAITYDLLPGFEFRYRFWSAVFGVAAVAMTGLLGARLFNWPVGLIAGLLLLTNRSFLTDHGARFGGMDAGLTACMAALLWIYWTGRTRQQMGMSWVGIGVVAGVASLLKPLGGLPMLAIIGLHVLLFPSRGRARTLVELRRPATAIAVTLACMAAVAAPWYVINAIRFPDDFFRLLFSQQIGQAVLGEAVDGDDTGLEWAFYLVRVTFSSTHFVLVVPAAAWILFRALRPAEPARSAVSLVTIAGLAWIATLSVAQKKFLHYAYPAFVPLTVAMAVTLGDVAGWIGRQSNRPSLARRVIATTIVILVLFAGWLGLHRLGQMSDPSPIWSLYQRWQADLQSGRARLVFVDIPHQPGQIMPDGRLMRPQLMIYLSHMKPAETVGWGDLDQVLAAREPTLFVLPPQQADAVVDGRVLIQEKWLTVVGRNVVNGPR